MATWKKILLEGEQANIGDSNLEISDQSRSLIMPDSLGGNSFSILYQQGLPSNGAPGSAALTISETYDPDTGLSSNKNIIVGSSSQTPASPTSVGLYAGKGHSLVLYGDGEAAGLGTEAFYGGYQFNCGATLHLYRGGINGTTTNQRFRVSKTAFGPSDASSTMGNIEWYAPEYDDGNADTTVEIEKGSLAMHHGIPSGNVDDVIFKVRAHDSEAGMQTVLEVGGSEHFPPTNGASQTATGWTTNEKILQGSRLQEESLWSLTNRFIFGYAFGQTQQSTSFTTPIAAGDVMLHGMRAAGYTPMSPTADYSDPIGSGTSNRGYAMARDGYLMGGSINCRQYNNATFSGRVELHVNVTNPVTGNETSYYVGSSTDNQTTYSTQTNINFTRQVEDIRDIFVRRGEIVTPYLKVITGATNVNYRIDEVIGYIDFYSEQMYPTA